MSNQPQAPSFTYRVEPSPLLSRLQSFLPQLKAANDQLQQDIARDGAGKYSFENTTGSETTIQMNLSLGVLEKQNTTDSNNEIAILPSQLAQMEAEKRDQRTEIALPWENSPTTNSSILEIADESGSHDDVPGDGAQRLKKQRQHEILQAGEAMDDDNELITLGTDVEQEKDFQLSQQLFGYQNPMSAAEAVEKLRQLGYEPVRDVSKGTDYITPSELSMCEDDSDPTTKPSLVQEIE